MSGSAKSVAMWFEIAQALNRKIDEASYGEREETLREEAAKKKLAGNTVRRALAAFQKLPQVGTATGLSVAELSTMPLLSLEAVARWLEYDPKNARKAALDVFGGKPVREIVRAERDARRKHGARDWGKSRRHRLKEIVEEDMKRRWPAMTKIVRTRDISEAADLEFDNEGRCIAAVLFGPHQHPRPRQAAEFVQRLGGMALTYDLTIAAVPERDHELVLACWERYLHSFIAGGLVDPKDLRPLVTIERFSLGFPSRGQHQRKKTRKRPNPSGSQG